MAARVEWPRWLESSPAAAVSGILRQFVELLAAPADVRRERVIAFLRETVSKVLGLSSSKLQNDWPLTDLGFDSLMAVELITALSTRIGVEVAAVKLLQGMSVSALSELVLEHLAAEGGGPSASSVVAPAAKVPSVQEVVSLELPKSRPSNNGGSTHNGGALHPSPAPTNGAGVEVPSLVPSAYSTLDYSRPTNGLRALRGVVTLALRTVAKVDIEGLENLPPTGGCLLATNHLSAADLPVLFSVVPRRTVMYAAERLRSSTVLNWLFSDVGDTIYVRRGEHDTEALESGLAVLRAGGLLALSPEGTRSQTGALARGRTGVAYLAMQAGVPVVPIALWGQERMPARWRSMRRAPVTVRIGPPLWFSHREPDAARLRECTDQVMRSIAEMLPEEYRGVYLTTELR